MMRKILINCITVYLTLTACVNSQQTEGEKVKAEISKYRQFVSLIENNRNDSLNLVKGMENFNFSPDSSLPLLHIAIKSQNAEAVRFLLKNGANPDIQANDEYMSTPLMESTNKNQLAVAKLLLENHADVNIVDKNGDPAINWSAYWGQEEMTALFLKYGAKTNLKSIHSPNTMFVALKEWNYNIVDLLIDSEIIINKTDTLAKQIVKAVKDSNFQQTRVIISSNKQLVNQRDESGTPIISITAKNGNFEIVKYLVDNGAKINVANPVGQTPLAFAARFGYENIVKYLLAKDANTNLSDSVYKLTPLIACSIGGNAEIGKMLIEKGALINQCDGINNHSPLIWASIYGNLAFVKMLLDYSPDLEIKSAYGFTAIDVANDSIKASINGYLEKKM